MDDLQKLLRCIDLEEEEQLRRYGRWNTSSDGLGMSLKQLKAEGVALHPVQIVRKHFGYADYPEMAFRLVYPAGSHQFRDGAAIECFRDGEESVKGILLNLDQNQGEFRLFAPDYPEWIDDEGVGIKLTPDTRTTKIMKQALTVVSEQPLLLRRFNQLHEGTTPTTPVTEVMLHPTSLNARLNDSQLQAVRAISQGQPLTIVHGPPGTGKTTTLVAAAQQLVSQGEKVVVSAPSNMAVDHFTRGLIRAGIQVLRVGNTSKVSLDILAHTPEGKLSLSKYHKDIKQLKIQAEDYRRMALKYKRHFGKEEREQRALLFKEVKQIRAEIKKLEAYHEEKLLEEAQVICGTPIGLYDAGLTRISFHSLIIDEAAQCLEPLAWVIIPLAERLVLAGDHHQLPPTILSAAAQRLGYDRSILEVAITLHPQIFFLNLQYRMRPMIAGFSNAYFYGSRLLTAPALQDTAMHVTFIDTAGSATSEEAGIDGLSRQNPGELKIIESLLMQDELNKEETVLITPYAAQATLAQQMFPSSLRVSTIDSFQGQEYPTVLISLVRSNDDGDIGFLKDYRRMNVALTRAKDALYVVGDSATLGHDPFYVAFLDYVEKHGAYKTIWEFL